MNNVFFKRMCLRYPGCPKWCRECCNFKKYLPNSVCYCIKLRIGCMIYGILQIILYSGLIGASLCFTITHFKNKEDGDWMINQLKGASAFVISFVGLISAILAVLSIALVTIPKPCYSIYFTRINYIV